MFAGAGQTTGKVKIFFARKELTPFSQNQDLRMGSSDPTIPMRNVQVSLRSTPQFA